MRARTDGWAAAPPGLLVGVTRDPVGRRQHLGCGAVVAGEADHLGALVLGGEAGQVLRVGAGERVDRLEPVPDDAGIVAPVHPQADQPVLQRRGVLVLVDHEVR